MNETVYFSVFMVLSVAVSLAVVKLGWIKPPTPKQRQQAWRLCGLLFALAFLLNNL